MLSNIIAPGDKVELTEVGSGKISEKNNKIKTYFSQIYDIIEDDKLKIAMPVEGTKPILMDRGVSYELYIFSSYGLYRCEAVFTERLRERNIYMAVLELTTELQKFQRRKYYRLECNIEIQYRLLTEEETSLLLNNTRPASFRYSLIDDGQIRGITVDISGGGARFVSRAKNGKGSHMLIEFDVLLGDEMKYFSLLAVEVDSRKLPDREIYEHRIQFEGITKQEREDLIKYIFEEERRFRKSEKG